MGGIICPPPPDSVILRPPSSARVKAQPSQVQVDHLYLKNITTSHIIRAGRSPTWALCASAWSRSHLRQQADICWSCWLHRIQGKPNARSAYAKHAGVHSRSPIAVWPNCGTCSLQSACTICTGIRQRYLVRRCRHSLTQTGAPPAPFSDVAWLHDSDLLSASWLCITAGTVRLRIDQVTSDLMRLDVRSFGSQRPLGLHRDCGHVPLIRAVPAYKASWTVPCTPRGWKSELGAEGLPCSPPSTAELPYAEQPTDWCVSAVSSPAIGHRRIRWSSGHVLILVTDWRGTCPAPFVHMVFFYWFLCYMSSCLWC